MRIVFFFLPLLFLNLAVATAQERFDFSAPIMATTFRISVHADTRAQAEAAADAAFQHLGKLHAILTDYEPTSDLIQLCNAVNAAAPGTPVTATGPLLDLLVKSQHLSQLTDGAFDVTCGNLTHLWRRARRQKKLPPPQRLQQALAATGWQALKVDAQAHTVAFSKPGLLLDVGGIAKGYAADEGLRILRQHGLTRALVMAGGDIAIGDPPPGQAAWEIKLRTFTKPSAGAEEPMETLHLKHCGVSTSGDLYQFTEIAGVRYSHIVSPKTGVGLSERVACSVIAPDCTTSDALATAMCVLGQQQGQQLIRQSFPQVTVKFASPQASP